jgi:drug/metabolite transporter (DMT)-like permease
MKIGKINSLLTLLFNKMTNRSVSAIGVISVILGIFAAFYQVTISQRFIYGYDSLTPYSQFALPLAIIGIALIAVGLISNKGYMRDNQESTKSFASYVFWSIVIPMFLVFIVWALMAYYIIK